MRREYLQRVLSTSFVVTTLAAPVLLLAIAATPALFANSNRVHPRLVVLVCSDAAIAGRIEAAMHQQETDGYRTEVLLNSTPHAREKLAQMVRESRIEGFLWLDGASIESGRIRYVSRAEPDDSLLDDLREITARALASSRLAANGVTPGAIADSLRPIRLDSITLTGEQSDAGGITSALIVIVLIITGLEMSLLSYGIMVMRSVLEDKTSRVVEVLLCSVTPRALMAGKILGIGAVSLTQVLIWSALAVSGIAAGTRVFGGLGGTGVSGGALAIFAALYVLGYLLYSSLYAAVGAAFSSVDDAQYWNFILTLPLLFSAIAAWSLFEQPSSPAAVWLSLAPPFAPVIMSMRIAVGSATAWQVSLSLVLMALATYGALMFAARVYRAGILMYGKKPSLSEIVRWLRYT